MGTRTRVHCALYTAALCLPPLVAACGGNGSMSPTTPTRPAPAIVVTAAPVPLVAVPGSGGAGSSRYRATADLVFRETAGVPARITRLRVDIAAPSGWSVTSSQDTDLAVTASGTAAMTLTTTFDAGGSDTSARWRLSPSGVGADGQTIEVAAIETELRIPPAQVPDAVFVGAGDIVCCDKAESAATARLLDGVPGTVFTAGDSVYPQATADLLAGCYEPTWGRHKWRTYPAPGNHEWEAAAGAPYFSHFGSAAGPAGLGYYSVTVGSWHVVSLNSNVAANAGTPQYEWLKADLAQSPALCTLAIWHHPLFSSGLNGNSGRMRDAWRLLMQAGAEIVLSGHDHSYERFAPQDADARSAPLGMRQFVIGTGGNSLHDRLSHQPNSEVWENHTWGVLKLTLKSGSYDWEFVPIAGQTFRDAGSASCIAPQTPWSRGRPADDQGVARGGRRPEAYSPMSAIHFRETCPSPVISLTLHTPR